MTEEQTGVAGVAEPPAVADEGDADPGRDAGGAVAAEAGTRGPGRGVAREYFESLVVTAVMALFGMTFVVQAVKVPTGSMQNTILVGDHLLVNKFIFAPGPPAFFLPQREIRRGDVIVFKYPGRFDSPQFRDAPEVVEDEDNQPLKTNYVKRVVGLPGDHLEERDGRLYINGVEYPERRLTAVNPGRSLPQEHRLNKAPLDVQAAPPVGSGDYEVFYPPDKVRAARGTFQRGQVFQVPADHYFVMGDNRDSSLDSRYWGYVRRDLVIGRALLVYWSYDESAPSAGNFIQSFFINTRWGRTGTLIR